MDKEECVQTPVSRQVWRKSFRPYSCNKGFDYLFRIFTEKREISLEPFSYTNGDTATVAFSCFPDM